MHPRSLKIKQFCSFTPTPEQDLGYELVPIGQNIITEFYNDLDQIIQDPNYILCARGSSKDNNNNHEYFINKELDLLFMVGEKAKSNYNPIDLDEFRYYDYEEQSKENILSEINRIIQIGNIEVEARNNHSGVYGSINSDKLNEHLVNLPKEYLAAYRVFFISWLHNNGKGKVFRSFKARSPFLSLTHGRRMLVIARKFALHQKKKKKGFIMITYIPNEYPYKIHASNLALSLKKYGVSWYADLHKEIMILNGVLPHYLLCILEVTVNKTPNLILNPWLYELYRKGEPWNIESGIPVDQEAFNDWILQSPFERVFRQYSHGEITVQDVAHSTTEYRVNKARDLQE